MATPTTAERKLVVLPAGKPVEEEKTTAPEPSTQATEKPQPASVREAAERPLRPVDQASGESATKSEAAGSKSPEPNLPDRVQLVQRVAHALRTAGSNGGHVHLRLHPPELGTLSVEVTLRDGAMTARLGTVTETARSLLLEHLPTLRENLAQHGVHIDRFDVDVLAHNNGGKPGHWFGHGFGQPAGDGPVTPTAHYAGVQAQEDEEALGTPSPVTEMSGLDVMA